MFGHKDSALGRLAGARNLLLAFACLVVEHLANGRLGVLHLTNIFATLVVLVLCGQLGEARCSDSVLEKVQ